MRNVFGIVVLVLALVGVRAGAAETVEVKVGERRVLEVGDMTRIALGNTEFAEVRTLGASQVEVKGEAPGQTTLLIWKKSGERLEYQVKVTGEAQAPKTDETLTLKLGETRALSAPGVTRVAVGDPEVSDIRVEGAGTLRVHARKVGETVLMVWTPEGRKAYRIVVQA